MNRQELRDRILRGLNEDASSPSFWSAAEVNSLIDEGAEVLAEEANSIKRTAFVPFREGATYYYTQSIAPDIMAPTRVWHHTLERRLIPATVMDLDAHNEVWATVNGDPWWWFPVAWNLFGVYPAPAAASGIMRVDYLAWPPALLDDEDEPEIPESDQEQLILYGIYDGLLKQWDLDRAIRIFALFADRLPEARYRKAVELKAVDLQVANVATKDGHVERIVRA